MRDVSAKIKRKCLKSIASIYVSYLTKMPKCNNISTERLGTNYGGWAVPVGALGADSIVYSAGAGEDISFDVGLASYFGCKVRIVDPTPRAREHFDLLCDATERGEAFPINGCPRQTYSISHEILSRLEFVPVGLLGRDEDVPFYAPADPANVSHSIGDLHGTHIEFTAPCYRLSTLLVQNDESHVDLLKLDIEGAEVSVLTDILDSGPFPQIVCVELDQLNHASSIRDLIRVEKVLNALARSGYCQYFREGFNICMWRGGVEETGSW